MKEILLFFVLIAVIYLLLSCKEDDNQVTPPSVDTFTWESTGLSNGTILSLVVNNNGNVFASVSGDGIYRTTDNGDTWSKIKNGPFQSTQGNGYAECLFVDGNTLWAGTDGAGIHSSVDEGFTWNDVSNGDSTGTVFAINVRYDENGNGTLYCGAINGIFRFNDLNGWEQLESNQTNTLCVTYEGYPGQGIYAGGPYQPIGYDNPGIILWSSNNGLSWYRTAVPGKVNAFAINSNGEIFACTGIEGAGILRKKSSWYTWEPVAGIEGGYSDNFKAIAITPSDHIFAGANYNGGVYRSIDNGGSWSRIVDGLTDQNVIELAVNPAGYIFAGTEAGVFRGQF